MFEVMENNNILIPGIRVPHSGLEKCSNSPTCGGYLKINGG